MCLLIIGLVVTGCGSSGGSSSSLNTPVIYNVTPTNSNSIADFVDSEGNITVTLTGVNFGSKEHGEVWFAGYESENSSTPKEVPFRLSLNYGGSWTDNAICFKIVKSTIDVFPYGAFYVVANGQQSPYSLRCSFGGMVLNNAKVENVSPSNVCSYDSNQTIVLTGTGFGNSSARQDLVLYTTTGYSRTILANEIYNWSDTQIILPLPVNDMANNIMSNATCYIRTNNSNNYVTLATFNFSVPELYAVEPSAGSIGKVVTLRGHNLGSSQGNLSVYCDSIYANVVSWSDNAIQVRIPNINTPGVKTFQLKRNSVNVGSSLSYEIKAPMLYNCSKTADLTFGDNVTIFGSNFGNADDLQNIYTYGRIEIAESNSSSPNMVTLYMSDSSIIWTENAITFNWPKFSSNLLSDKTFTIKVIVGNEAFMSNAISVTD